MTSAFRAASPAPEALRVAARKVSLLLSVCLLLALSSCGLSARPRSRATARTILRRWAVRGRSRRCSISFGCATPTRRPSWTSQGVG